ncbi:uncharacterized protein DS421_14g453920 [Arachis hypogaea]|nr:uncharacterized protein DS421_14g453920 [Arachis hypogaea]
MQRNGYYDDYNARMTNDGSGAWSRRCAARRGGVWRTPGRENCYDEGRGREKSRTTAMVLSNGIDSGEGRGVFGAERWRYSARLERAAGRRCSAGMEGAGGAVLQGWEGLLGGQGNGVSLRVLAAGRCGSRVMGKLGYLMGVGTWAVG